MALQFHNSLTRRLEPFQPLDPAGKLVRLYTCGPTVYDFAHIGNLRTFLFEDLLKRYLEFKGYEVHHVMNITDVEDKIIRKVRETGKTWQEITEQFTAEFLKDIDALRIKRANEYPRATSHIPEMLSMIETLLTKGYAYKTEEGSIYYRISKFPTYGELAHIRTDELMPGARVASDEYDKETVADFALWKAWDSQDGAVAWDTKFGKGRPGWHLECSAMCQKYLGDQIDIHCGGIDNLFPHHQNEIAQTEACTGKKFVRCWLHSQHLQVNGQKMSKSLGNFHTLRDLLEKGYDPREIRYALIRVNYRLGLNFTLENLQEAKQALERIDNFILRLREVENSNLQGTPSGEVQSLGDHLISGFTNCMDDDLNISGALGELFKFITSANALLDHGISSAAAKHLLNVWQRIDSVLAIAKAEEDAIPPEISQLAQERAQARAAKQWKRSDEIRDLLKSKGWLVEDTSKGQRIKKA